MMELHRALRRVARRIRLTNGTTAAQWALALCALLAVGWVVCSFFRPVERLPLFIGVTALGAFALCCLMALLRPVSLREAARRADACGLAERSSTALECEGETDMLALQRDDALRALCALDLRKRMPVRWQAKPLALAGGLVALCLLSLLLPNPQTDVLRERAALREQLATQAQKAEAFAADEADEAIAPDTRSELNRSLRELAKELREAEDRRDALEALDDAETRLKRMERALSPAMQAATQSLASAGLSAMAEALSDADADALSDALSQNDQQQAETLSDALAAAAQAAESDAALSAALSAAATAATDANPQSAKASADRLARAAQAGTLGNASALLSSIRSACTQGAQSASASAPDANGQSGSSGQGGTGASSGKGGGAGQGTTNEDAGISAESRAQGGSETARHTDKTGEYEQIYDPTSLQTDGDATAATGETREGESMEITLAPGAGTLDGSVPYNRVMGDYRQAAVQTAQYEELPEYARAWVDAYFTALTE